MANDDLFAVLLAAGSGRRFGATKQLAEINGVPLATTAARLCEAICGPRSVVVLGKDWSAVHLACQPLAGFFAMNPDYETGMASSIRCGIAPIRPHAGGVLLLLADQPLVSIEHLRALETCWRASPRSIVASAYSNTFGPPIIFPRQDFARLCALREDAGAKEIVLENAERLQTIEYEAAAVDIDRPEHLQSL